MDERRKRLLYRATHRGTREADRLIGGFAEANLERLGEGDLTELEALLEESDVDLVNWILGRDSLPEGRIQPMLRRIIDFKNSR